MRFKLELPECLIVAKRVRTGLLCSNGVDNVYSEGIGKTIHQRVPFLRPVIWGMTGAHDSCQANRRRCFERKVTELGSEQTLAVRGPRSEQRMIETTRCVFPFAPTSTKHRISQLLCMQPNLGSIPLTPAGYRTLACFRRVGNTTSGHSRDVNVRLVSVSMHSSGDILDRPTKHRTPRLLFVQTNLVAFRNISRLVTPACI